MKTKVVCVFLCVLMITSVLAVTFPQAESEVTATIVDVDQNEQSVIASEEEQSTKELTIIFGTDSNDHPGQGLGQFYYYKSGTYESYNSRYDYDFEDRLYESYTSDYEYEYRAWSVFDLSDLAQLGGVSITSGRIVYRQDYRYQVSNINFWTLGSIPYGYVYGSQAQQWFNEAGGAGTTNLGSVVFSGTYDNINQNISTPISTDGLAWLNNKVDSEDYDVPIGSNGIYSNPEYGYVCGGDVRLVLTLTYDDILQDAGEIAIGDDLSGYSYGSTYKYDNGRLCVTSSYRAYASWDIDDIKAAIPQTDQYGNRIAVTGVSLRVNHHAYSCRLNTMGLYSMEYDPRVADGVTQYTDAADGTQYVYMTDSTYYSNPIEFEWDLGEDALSDLISSLEGESDFFAIGLSGSQCSAYYLGAPKLVIEWEVAPPEITLIFGTDNNDYPGQGLGHVYYYKSGATESYNSRYNNNFYNYRYESTSSDYTYGYRPWMVFDLSDLTQFEGTSITSGSILYRQDYRSGSCNLDFWTLNSVPYGSFSGPQAQQWLDEAGGAGTTNLGNVIFSGSYDPDNQNVSTPISTDGLAWLNNKVDSEDYDIPIGSCITLTDFYYSYISGGDVRLALTLTYNEILHDTGEIAIGDDISGYLYSSGGYAYLQDVGRISVSSDYYRAYAAWDIEDIKSALPLTYRNDDEITVTGVSLRLNHHAYSCYIDTLGLYSMEYDPRVATAAVIYADAIDGTQYVYLTDTAYYSVPHEFEWDLGEDALSDLQNALDGAADFFAVGFSRTQSYGYYFGAPRLVIEWQMGREPPVADLGTDIVIDEGDTALLDGSAAYSPQGTIVAYDWDFESDGIFDYSETTESAPDGAFDGMTTYTYGDDGVYTVTLKVTDDIDASATDTCDVTVYNVAPVIESFGPLVVDEGSPITISAVVTDPGSDDLTLTWEWGDGTSPTSTVLYNAEIGPEPVYETSTNEIRSPAGTYPFSASDEVTHTYGDDSVYTIIFTAVDDDGGITTYTTTIDVNNVAPSITEFTVPSSVNEGSIATCEADAYDPGSDDLTFTWEFELGTTSTNIYYNDDIGPDPPESPEGTYPFSVTDTVGHTYNDNGEYILSLTIEDDDGGISTYSTTIIVYNVAPVITPFGPFAVDEGSALDLTAVGTDIGSDDLTFTWEFGNGPTVTEVFYNDGIGSDPYPSPWGTSPFSATSSAGHTYDDNGFFILTLTVEDDDGGVTVYSTDITVNNVAPTAYAEYDQTVDEGAEAIFVGDFTDPGTADTHIFMWDFGDGTPGSSELSPTHAYGDNGVYTVYFTVVDDDGGANTDSVTVTVTNVAPTVDAGPDQIVYSGETVVFAGSFSDPGWLDTHTTDWDFGDGQTDSDTLTPTHIYLIAATYGVTMTVTDDDGGVGSDSLSVTVLRIPVIIDVKPCSDKNPINTKSKGKIPVAIINNGIFDPALVNPETVLFGPNGASPTHWNFKDVDDDGDIDLMLHFNTQETGIVPGDISVTLYADLYDGRQVVGEDNIE
ncbi:MAG: PKD domain-containing protein, partial [Candidatus Thorarchaeota archaeon]